MSAQDEARRRWPSYPTVGFSGAEDRQDAFVAGATWQRERVSVERIAEVLDALDAEWAVAFRAWSLDTDPATARTPPAEVSNAARAERIHADLFQTESNEEPS